MNLYVSNLMSHITAEDLKKLFLPFGYVASTKVITDKFTGVSRGFGFVVMPQQEEADKAMRELEGKNVDGRNISVAEARERTDRRSY
ncbi:RNA-binding protein [Chitinophaga agrisoli]|uniref:RNA-binding protein n=1 Tax=Chitinophaga agrisoli TaxID=2607653 RepID=A0A5B2VK96_9BACT|nr:RNA-binding protein [Chitinophaga agrisoli]KAA2239010.1 RNA-binding protein [Chitinophaga agrisoli]